MAAASPTSPAKPRARRGRESAGDMVRSLGLVMLIVVPLWFLAQPPAGDEQEVRVVDPAADVASFRRAAPGVPVPGPLPAGWRATSSTLEPGALRIGWVTPAGEYAEYSATTGPATDLPGRTGAATEAGSTTVAGIAYRQYDDGQDHTSLVREAGGGTVVVGGVRETTTLEELRVLAAAVR